MGASSGIGYELARLYIERGWLVGLCARRYEELERLRSLAPDRVHIRRIDVCDAEAPRELETLINELGGLDIYLHSSGIGKQNKSLKPEISLSTLEVNVSGFTRMLDFAFEYFARQGKGHLVAISSIAGTRGLGPATAYSASKAYQASYIQALAQLKYLRGLSGLHLTEIRPGFVDTALLDGAIRYPMMMHPERVARAIVRAVDARRRVCTIDWRYRVLVALWRLIPRPLWERFSLP